MINRLLSFAILALLVAVPASAQTSRLVDPLDPSYLELQQLVDAGLIDRVSLGQRPVSRAAFARALDQAAARLGAGKTNTPRRAVFYRELVSTLQERLHLGDSLSMNAELPSRFALLRTASLDATRTDQPTRLIPSDNGLGNIDGWINSMLENRQGRALVEGLTTTLETTHALETKHVALALTPHLSIIDAIGAAARVSARLQEAQFRLLSKNLALDIGREYLVWGQGRDGGLLNSNNSPPLDLIKLSSEQPFYLPWFLHGFGPTRLAIFYADLGVDQNFPHAHLIGYRANIAPFSALDLGVSVYTKSGGRGAPRATLTARLIDLLPFLDASAYNNAFGTRGHFEFSDHYAGFDGRLRLRPLGSSFYWDVLMNDFDVRRLRSVLWEDAGHVFGLDLPPLSPSGRLRASVEYHHTGIRYYEHQQFLSGQTVHHVLTGDPLGPDAQGGYAHLDWYKSASIRAGLHFAVERRSNDQYAYIPEPNFGFRKTEERPKEWQARVLAEVQLLPSVRQFGTFVQFGYQRTRNFDFVEGNGRNSFLGRATISYRLQ